MRSARSPGSAPGHFAHRLGGDEREWRTWTFAQLVLAASLVATLTWALVVFVKSGADLPLGAGQRSGFGLLLAAGLAFFIARCVYLALQLQSRSPRR